MSGIVSIDARLNGIVKEYLSIYGFDQTLRTFLEECSQKNKSIVDVENNSNQNFNLKLINDLIGLFHQGQQKEFFRRWNENIPQHKINEDLHAQKLELELNIHFSVFPFRIGTSDQQTKENLNYFKEYIENKGRVLCQTKDFLPYFGLPYHPNPHEGFPELFTDSWLANLQKKLGDFLYETLTVQLQPKLVDLYNNQSDTDTIFNIAKMKQQLIESEKRTMAFMRKFNKVQTDYHSLIGITAELVDTLESSISGKPVSTEYVQKICFKLFNTQLKQTIDLTRPGTAGDYIRKSLAIQRSNTEKIEIKTSYPSLDFIKLKHDLINQNEKRKILLLQALRWRLTKADSTELRQRVLTSYIAADILNCRSERISNNFIDFLKSSNPNIKEFMARLINAFSSLNHGRSYLASNLDMIKRVFSVLKSEKEDTYTKKNLLAALQKLSLRHRLQMLMINENLIDYLINLLEDNETLSDYSLEYAVALFMNLTLKNSGKKKCINDHKRILKVISELLGNSPTIQTYVNASLYNILSVPQIKEHAKTINLESILKNYSSDGDETVNKQRRFIIDKINSENDAQLNEEDREEEDEDDEEDAELMELELDSGEFIAKSSIDLSGEQLLITEYSLNNQNTDFRFKNLTNEFLGSDNGVINNRPVTPHHIRQSKQFGKPELNNSRPPPTRPSNNNNSYMRPRTINGSGKDSNLNRQSFSLKNRSSSHGGGLGSSKNNQNTVPVGNKMLDDDQNEYHPSSYSSNGKVSDILVIDSHEMNSKLMHVNDSVTGFVSKPKVQHTPDQSMAVNHGKGNNYKSLASTTSSTNSFMPKYSVAEPRPSSSNSLKNSDF